MVDMDVLLRMCNEILFSKVLTFSDFKIFAGSDGILHIFVDSFIYLIKLLIIMEPSEIIILSKLMRN